MGPLFQVETDPTETESVPLTAHEQPPETAVGRDLFCDLLLLLTRVYSLKAIKWIIGKAPYRDPQSKQAYLPRAPLSASEEYAFLGFKAYAIIC